METSIEQDSCAAPTNGRALPAVTFPPAWESRIGQTPTLASRAKDAFSLATGTKSLKVLTQLAPSLVRGFVLRHVDESPRTRMHSSNDCAFDWRYTQGDGDMHSLFERAQRLQWSASEGLPWHISVDPENEEAPLVSRDFFDLTALRGLGVHLDEREKQRLRLALASWMISQFLHGEQGALYAAAQAVEATPDMIDKQVGATQVMDEARHIAVFERYLRTKLGRVYDINDNLYTTIDALIGDRRWDVKFIGMHIIVEGLALSAFGNLQKRTSEPLLQTLLQRVVQDEARHVQFGLLTLRKVMSELSERERLERDEWAFEVAMLTQGRFVAYEVYDEWFAHAMSRATWQKLMTESPGMSEFHRVMYARLARNLRSIGLFSPRLAQRYVKAGLVDARSVV